MKRLLIILPNNLGDVIMAMPLLEGQKRNYPDTHVTFFVEQGYEAGLQNCPDCDRIFRFDRKSVRDAAQSPDWRQSIALLKNTIQELASERFDRVINLSQHPYASIAAALVSDGEVLGSQFLREGNHALCDRWSQYLYAIPFARRCNSLHASDVYRLIGGVGTGPAAGRLVVTADEKRKAGELLATAGIDCSGESPVVLQPGAAYPAKCWPIEHFISLGKALAAQGRRLIITGAPAEREIAAALGAQIGGAALVVAGTVTFRETIALLPFAGACVSGDTAIMHAAAALGRPVFALFGTTNPVETGPFGRGFHVLSGRCKKRPCFCLDCKSRLCMKSIMPDDVVALVQGERLSTASCDVYTTAIGEDGMCFLEPIIEQGPDYFDRTASAVTRKFAQPDYQPDFEIANDSAALVKQDSVAVCNVLDRMARALSEFFPAGPSGAVARFENERRALQSLSGIAEFWAAIANIRLNSVPLLDPAAGVRESMRVCLETKEEILSALSILP